MSQRYTLPAIFLHWFMALGLVGTFALGFYMEGLPFSPDNLKLIAWHKWAGISLLGLIAVRLVWRLTHPAPSLPSSMSASAKFAAHLGHWLLYGLMVAIPLTGWLASSAQGVSVVWLGMWQLPDLLAKDPELGTWLQDVHMVLNYVLAVGVIGHVAAALHHQFVRKDGLLRRMWPRLESESVHDSST